MWTDREDSYNDQEELDARYGEGFTALTNLCLFGIFLFLSVLIYVCLFGIK